jgi:hypothetical protein
MAVGHARPGGIRHGTEMTGVGPGRTVAIFGAGRSRAERVRGSRTLGCGHWCRRGGWLLAAAAAELPGSLGTRASGR